jgi:hypothetical protein
MDILNRVGFLVWHLVGNEERIFIGIMVSLEIFFNFAVPAVIGVVGAWWALIVFQARQRLLKERAGGTRPSR